MVQLQKNTAERSSSTENLSLRMREIEDRLFAEFSRSVGVASIREYEDSRLKSQEERAAKKLQLAVKESRLQNQCVDRPLLS